MGREGTLKSEVKDEPSSPFLWRTDSLQRLRLCLEEGSKMIEEKLRMLRQETFRKRKNPVSVSL